MDHPLSPGYAAKYGIPDANMNFDFVEQGVLKPGQSFITRTAPGVGINTGGGIEIVTNPRAVRLSGFSTF
jgi:hypothetical protein